MVTLVLLLPIRLLLFELDLDLVLGSKSGSEFVTLLIIERLKVKFAFTRSADLSKVGFRNRVDLGAWVFPLLAYAITT